MAQTVFPVYRKVLCSVHAASEVSRGRCTGEVLCASKKLWRSPFIQRYWV